MFCSNCGAPLAPGAAFCQVCGTAVPQSAQAAAPVQPAPQQPAAASPVQRMAKRSRRKTCLVIAGALFGVLVVCSIIGLLVDSEPEEQAAVTTPAPAVTSSPSPDLTPPTISEPIAAAEPTSAATVAAELTPAPDAAALQAAAAPYSRPYAAEPAAPAPTKPPPHLELVIDPSAVQVGAKSTLRIRYINMGMPHTKITVDPPGLVHFDPPLEQPCKWRQHPTDCTLITFRADAPGTVTFRAAATGEIFSDVCSCWQWGHASGAVTVTISGTR